MLRPKSSNHQLHELRDQSVLKWLQQHSAYRLEILFGGEPVGEENNCFDTNKLGNWFKGFLRIKVVVKITKISLVAS